MGGLKEIYRSSFARTLIWHRSIRAIAITSALHFLCGFSHAQPGFAATRPIYADDIKFDFDDPESIAKQFGKLRSDLRSFASVVKQLQSTNSEESSAAAKTLSRWTEAAHTAIDLARAAEFSSEFASATGMHGGTMTFNDYQNEYHQLIVKRITELVQSFDSLDDSATIAAIDAVQCLGHRVHIAAPALERVALNRTRTHDVRLAAATSVFFVTPENVAVSQRLMSAFLEMFYTSEPIESRTHKNPMPDDDEIPDLMSTTIGLASGFAGQSLVLSGHTMVEIRNLSRISRGSGSLELRGMAIGVLETLAPEASESRGTLWSLLDDPNGLIRLLAASAILAQTPDPQVLAVLADRLILNANLRQRLEDSVWHKATSQSSERLSTRRLLLEHPLEISGCYIGPIRFGSGSQRRAALRELRDAGPLPDVLKSEIIHARQSSDPQTRRLAAEVLEQSAPALNRYASQSRNRRLRFALSCRRCR